jgi:hypothetical protein
MSIALKPGMSIDLPDELVAQAAVADLPMLDRMHSARREDILAFIAKVSVNWEVEFFEHPFRTGRRWEMHKPARDVHEFVDAQGRPHRHVMLIRK